MVVSSIAFSTTNTQRECGFSLTQKVAAHDTREINFVISFTEMYDK
jgi:hypothetical protein